MSRAELRIGTSGYQYDHWAGGVFYPAGLPKKRWFAWYARTFDTVEINNTFYRLPRPEVFESWEAQAPRGFCYAVKMSRYATHMKRLRDPAEPIGRFLDGAERLGRTLGPILVQLPPHWRADPERLRGFLEAAPGRHRWAVEVRDPSWLCEPVLDVLRAHGAALVVHDHIADHPHEVTADWVYVRFHGGPNGTYADETLRREARWMQRQRRAGRSVYAYFNNDIGGHATRDAIRLREMMGAKPLTLGA